VLSPPASVVDGRQYHERDNAQHRQSANEAPDTSVRDSHDRDRMPQSLLAKAN
jgi:hypothetical protein